MSRAMKPSGIEWIGDIPEKWSINRINSLYLERNSKVSDKEFKPLSVTKNGIVPQLESAAKSDDSENRKLVEIGDFVINSRSDRRGSCGISNYTGSVSLINTVLIPKNSTINDYFSFAFKTERFADEYYKWGNGIVDDLWSTKWSSFKQICICTPSPSEQRAIADYLDGKCELIDSTIEKQKTAIEKLKLYRQSVITEAVTKGLDPTAPMKPSGIEWIGETPKAWRIVRLKNIAMLNPSYIEAFSDGTNVSFSPMEYIGQGKMETSVIEIEKVKNGYTYFANGDVIMAKVTPCFENGNIALADNLLNGVGYGSSELYVFRCKNVTNIFLFYFLQNYIFKKYCTSSMCGTGGLKRVPAGIINSYKLALPPLPEQQAIADYLDQKCAQIDQVIERKQKLIEKLSDYKKSLIYECVTGKREVGAS